ncbi:MAG: response regulator transcription factor [Erysipelothrix sp.]|nr:response regulator transcription factor [Erysipelothrix sp.]
MKRILLIEDEPQIARFVQLELNHEGYDVTVANDGRDGLEVFHAHPFDLVLLDIMLPSLNGIEVLRRIRQLSNVPIIMLTARDSVMDKVNGLDNGADDYITKPFAIEELLARLRNLLRKQVSQTSILSYKSLILDLNQHECSVNNVQVDLTKKEFDLLHMLLKHKNQVLSRELLIEKIWGYEFDGTTNSIDVYVRYLRSKIEEPFDEKFIHTIRGVGYIIKDE